MDEECTVGWEHRAWGEELGGDEGGETVVGCKIKTLALSESCGICTYYSVDSSCFPNNSALINELWSYLNCMLLAYTAL